MEELKTRPDIDAHIPGIDPRLVSVREELWSWEIYLLGLGSERYQVASVSKPRLDLDRTIRPTRVNWSGCGERDLQYTKAFSMAILLAIELAESDQLRGRQIVEMYQVK